jgi:hypothetical protein
MSSLLTKIAVSALAFAGAMSAAHADESAYRVQYKTTYSNWDRTVRTTYNYSERSSYSQCGHDTCYYRGTQEWRSSDTVYVRETVAQGGTYNGYHQVTVYEDSGYASPYCSYYTRYDSVSGRDVIIYREFHESHVYIYNPFAITEGVALLVQNFDSDLQALAVTGGIAMDVGLQIANAGAISDSKDATEAGLIIAGAGLGSAISASLEQSARDQARSTALEQAVQANESQSSSNMSSVP